jgi:hypothetical protein
MKQVVSLHIEHLKYINHIIDSSNIIITVTTVLFTCTTFDNLKRFEIPMRKFYVPVVSLLMLDVRNSVRVKTCYHLEELLSTIFPISLEKIVKLRHKRNNFALWTSYCNFYCLLITKIVFYLTIFLCICICYTLDLHSPFSMDPVPEVY